MSTFNGGRRATLLDIQDPSQIGATSLGRRPDLRYMVVHHLASSHQDHHHQACLRQVRLKVCVQEEFLSESQQPVLCRVACTPTPHAALNQLGQKQMYLKVRNLTLLSNQPHQTTQCLHLHLHNPHHRQESRRNSLTNEYVIKHRINQPKMMSIIL